MRAVGYIRVSTEEQALGAEAQRRIIEEFCHVKNLQLEQVFEDVGISGGVPAFQREGFRRMVEYCTKNRIPIIVVYSIDRLGRSFYDIFETLRKLEYEYNITILSIREEFLQLLDRRIRTLILAVLSWVAWYERYLTRERTRQALRTRGVKHSVDIPEEKRRLILDLYTKLNYSIKKISKLLNISERQVRKVLYLEGILKLPEDTCPRCFHKMRPDDQYDNKLYCPNCGYLKDIT